MRHSLISLAAIVILPWAGAMAQEPLPDDVAQLYVAYQQAEQSGDLEAILASADAVYRAARRARVDDVTLGTLAENLAFYAGHTGDFERSYETWREAAEYAEDAEEGPLVGGFRWHQAAQAALAGNEVGEAARCSQRAIRHLTSDPAIQQDYATIFAEAHFLNAAANFRRGRYSRLVDSAQVTIDVFAATNRPADAIYGRAHYYRGVGAIVDREYEDAVVHLHLAGDIFELTAPEGEELEIARGLSSVAYLLADNPEPPGVSMIGRRGDFDRDDFQSRVDGRLEASEFHRMTMGNEPNTQNPLPDGATPAERISFDPPRYPRQAQQRGIEGIAIVEFDVGADGLPTNIETRISLPMGFFEEVAEDAVRSMRYEPARHDGEAIEHPDRAVQFNFALADRRDLRTAEE